MAKFKKKPIIVEVMQYDGKNKKDIFKWAKNLSDPHDPQIIHFYHDGGTWLQIKTLEGSLVCKPDDWIICGIEGEFYPCKPSIFEKTYEPYEPRAKIKWKIDSGQGGNLAERPSTNIFKDKK